MLYFLQQSLNALQLGSLYALIALGYSMVYGVLRMINFAHGDLFMLGAFASFVAATWLGAGFVPALVISMLVVGLAGGIIERLAYRPLRNAPHVSAIITALGVGIFLENFTLALSPYPQAAPQLISPRTYVFYGLSISNIQILIIAVSALLMLALDYLVQKTLFGMAMRAVSFNRRNVPLMGIPVDRVIAFTFAVGASLGAAAGVLYATAFPVIEPYMGIMVGWKAFISAVLGGIGNVRGAVLGSFLLASVEIFVAAFLPSTWRDLISFTLLLVLLTIRPQGILGKPSIQKI